MFELPSLLQFKKVKSHEKVCQNKDFCGAAMPLEDTKMLEFNQYVKSDKMPYTIYANLESLLVKIDGCKNNSENNLKQK